MFCKWGSGMDVSSIRGVRILLNSLCHSNRLATSLTRIQIDLTSAFILAYFETHTKYDIY